MGWFSNATKNLRPDKILRDPKKALQLHFDPAGTVVRAGRGQDMPGNARSFLDPGGFFEGRDPVKYPTYQPGGQLRLSQNAQQLYDQMKARTAERNAARAVPQAAPQAAPQGNMAGMVHRFTGRVMADGGKVRSGALAGCEHYESKAFERKKNGKPS